jgi:DNA-binding MarR family transcriptional regulator
MSTGPAPPPFDETAPGEARAVVRAFLSEEEEQAWIELLETHAALITALDARLLDEHHMPLGEADALMQIAHAEHGSLSVSELAELLRLSPSRTSRLAIDLERHGLVERQRDANDSRSTRVAATQAGRDRLLQAAPAYFSTVREHLFTGLSERDIKQLTRILGRMQAARPPSTSTAPASPISPLERSAGG